MHLPIAVFYGEYGDVKGIRFLQLNETECWDAYGNTICDLRRVKYSIVDIGISELEKSVYSEACSILKYPRIDAECITRVLQDGYIRDDTYQIVFPYAKVLSLQELFSCDRKADIACVDKGERSQVLHSYCLDHEFIMIDWKGNIVCNTFEKLVRRAEKENKLIGNVAFIQDDGEIRIISVRELGMAGVQLPAVRAQADMMYRYAMERLHMEAVIKPYSTFVQLSEVENEFRTKKAVELTKQFIALCELQGLQCRLNEDSGIIVTLGGKSFEQVIIPEYAGFMTVVSLCASEALDIGTLVFPERVWRVNIVSSVPTLSQRVKCPRVVKDFNFNTYANLDELILPEVVEDGGSFGLSVLSVPFDTVIDQTNFGVLRSNRFILTQVWGDFVSSAIFACGSLTTEVNISAALKLEKVEFITKGNSGTLNIRLGRIARLKKVVIPAVLRANLTFEAVCIADCGVVEVDVYTREFEFSVSTCLGSLKAVVVINMYTSGVPKFDIAQEAVKNELIYSMVVTTDESNLEEALSKAKEDLVTGMNLICIVCNRVDK